MFEHNFLTIQDYNSGYRERLLIGWGSDHQTRHVRFTLEVMRYQLYSSHLMLLERFVPL